MKTVKVGMLPGRLEELALEVGTTVADAIEIAGLDTNGFEIKVDGTVVTDPSTAIVSESTNLVLLVRKIKGNASSVKVGMLPGRLEEFAFEAGTTIAQAIEFAELDADGYEVKVDGTTVTDLNVEVGDANLVLLVRKVKGNARIK